MICKPCRTAGQALALGWRDIADQQHELCPAVLLGQPTHCDCAHRTEQSYVNPEKVSDADTADTVAPATDAAADTADD